MDKTQQRLMVKINDDRDEIAFSNLFDYFAPKLRLICTSLSSDISGANSVCECRLA